MSSLDEIYGELMDCFTAETGMELRDSCDLAVRFYAVAAQVEGLYYQLDWVKNQCFPQTATGDQLDYHATLRSLSRKEAACAQGTIRFIASEGQTVDRVIDEGTVGLTAGLIRFVTTQEAVIAVGEDYVDVPAQAEEAGSQGNVAPLAIVSMASAPVGIEQCSNLAAFTGGTDGEDDETLRGRILDSYSRLPNGVNVAYYEQESLEYDGVVAVTVIPCARGVGTVDVVIAASGGLPSDSLVEELGAYFEARREIAVQVEVRAPDTLAVAVNVQVAASSGYEQATVESAVEEAIASWFGGEGLGRDVLVAQLGSLVFSCDGVANCKIVSPSADVAVAEDELPLVSTLTVGVLA